MPLGAETTDDGQRGKRMGKVQKKQKINCNSNQEVMLLQKMSEIGNTACERSNIPL